MRCSGVAITILIAFGTVGHGQGSDPFRFLSEGGIPSGQLKSVWAALPYDSITLERSGCMVPCPAYKVTLRRGVIDNQRERYEDRLGAAELHARVPARNLDDYTRQFPEKSGEFTGRVDIWSYARLCKLISAVRFHAFVDGYRAPWTDDRTVTISVTGNGKTKTVSEYGGWGPIELWGLQEAIDSTAKGIKWSPR